MLPIPWRLRCGAASTSNRIASPPMCLEGRKSELVESRFGIKGLRYRFGAVARFFGSSLRESNSLHDLQNSGFNLCKTEFFQLVLGFRTATTLGNSSLIGQDNGIKSACGRQLPITRPSSFSSPSAQGQRHPRMRKGYSDLVPLKDSSLKSSSPVASSSWQRGKNETPDALEEAEVDDADDDDEGRA